MAKSGAWTETHKSVKLGDVQIDELAIPRDLIAEIYCSMIDHFAVVPHSVQLK